MSKLNPLAAVIGAAVVSSSLSLSAMAANPFQAYDLSSGYQLAEGKAGEGKCGGEKKDAEGKCGGDKDAEGKCGAEKDSPKDAEGKCGEGKCAGNKDKGEGKKDAEGKCGAKG